MIYTHGVTPDTPLGVSAASKSKQTPSVCASNKITPNPGKIYTDCPFLKNHKLFKTHELNFARSTQAGSHQPAGNCRPGCAAGGGMGGQWAPGIWKIQPRTVWFYGKFHRAASARALRAPLEKGMLRNLRSVPCPSLCPWARTSRWLQLMAVGLWAAKWVQR